MPRLNILFHHHDTSLREQCFELFQETDLIKFQFAETPESIAGELEITDYQILVLSLSAAQLDEGRLIYNILNRHRLLQVILVSPMTSVKALINARELGADDVVFKNEQFKDSLNQSILALAGKLSRWNITLKTHFISE